MTRLKPTAAWICWGAMTCLGWTATLQAGDHQKPYRDVTFDTIKFDMEKGEPFKRSMLTAEIKKLDGKPLRIRGYILPSFQQTGIKQFVLVRDNMECCFGPGAALFDCVLVELADGVTTDYTVRPVSVAGKFTIRELVGPDGNHLAIYHIEGQEVK